MRADTIVENSMCNTLSITSPPSGRRPAVICGSQNGALRFSPEPLCVLLVPQVVQGWSGGLPAIVYRLDNQPLQFAAVLPDAAADPADVDTHPVALLLYPPLYSPWAPSAARFPKNACRWCRNLSGASPRTSH